MHKNTIFHQSTDPFRSCYNNFTELYVPAKCGYHIFTVDKLEIKLQNYSVLFVSELYAYYTRDIKDKWIHT